MERARSPAPASRSRSAAHEEDGHEEDGHEEDGQEEDGHEDDGQEEGGQEEGGQEEGGQEEDGQEEDRMSTQVPDDDSDAGSWSSRSTEDISLDCPVGACAHRACTVASTAAETARRARSFARQL
ncbi:MAG TPA: hypothetical protein VMF65_11630 [Acidimicrobiales bacterium]|nr:hypothetical protein [Acidimicrobiales bacterium]